MRSTTKKRTPLSASNAKRLEELCVWITENFDQTLGWTQLTNKSGFSKEQLVELFQLYKQESQWPSLGKSDFSVKII